MPAIRLSSPYRVAAFVIAALGVATVVSTYAEFNNMYDEPAHLAAGMEWLSRGTYTLEPQHPPLSRIASAILPWLSGERSPAVSSHMYAEGREILGRGEHYWHVLTLARLGHIPFLLLLLGVTWTWARRLGRGNRVAAVAVFLAAANPNILAHAGVAGTDIGPAAMMPAALLAWVLWLEQPTRKRSVIMGIAVAVCGLVKFSALAFWLPAAMMVALIVALRERDRFFGVAGARTLGKPLLLAIGIAALTTWATYRFSVGAVGDLTLPAPEFWIGLRDFFAHGAGGHPAYIFGEVRLGGWWYYDIVVLLVKTPIPLLVFGTLGTWLVLRGRREPIALAPVAGVASVVLVASLTPVDLGVRLLLAAYPLLAILGAVGAVWAWERSARASSRFVVAALAGWMLIDVATTHPHHIAYFNVFAGPHPERILVDSNLDWGQDLHRLRKVSLAQESDSIRVHYFGTAEFAALGLERTRRLRPNERAKGWVAASETFYAGVWADTSLKWLREYEPVARVGRSIRLYYIQ